MGQQASLQPGVASSALDIVNYYRSHYGDGTDAHYLKGKLAIVTGGNSGIGTETCKALAYAGCRVILCSRSVSNAEEAVKTEIKELGLGGYSVENAEELITIKQLDLNCMQSIRKFAEEFIKDFPNDSIDYLVLNAGIMALPNKEYTADGFEKQIGVNHFGHAFLTSLLMGRLGSQANPVRVVSLASNSHRVLQRTYKLHVGDLHSDHKPYNKWANYAQSKLCNILYARSLASVLEANEVAGNAVSVHPGIIASPLWKEGNAAVTAISRFVLGGQKSIPQGAATTVFACLSPEYGGDNSSKRGIYLEDCGIGNCTAAAKDDVLAYKLWTTTLSQLQRADNLLKEK